MKFVLIHGATLDERSWHDVVPLLDHDAVLVTQPGRALNPVDDASSITLADYRENVAAVVRETEGDIVLVGHSMGGLSVGAGIAAAPDRVKHAVFVSCAIPVDGNNIFSLGESEPVATLDRGPDVDRMPLDVAGVGDAMGRDLTAEQLAWTQSVMVAEPIGAFRDPFSAVGLDLDVPKTWVRLTEDTLFPPAFQDVMAARAGATQFRDLATDHLPMFSRPSELAAILNDIAAGR